MESIKVEYDQESDTIIKIEGEKTEPWIGVCERFNDDVHRIRNISDMDTFTGLFECINDENKVFHYIVEEDKALYKYKRRNVYKKLGFK